MPKNTLEVLVGTGTLYVAPTGTAFPADPSVTPAGTWVDIGYSEEGWSFNAEVNVEEVEVAEEIDPIDLLATAREVHFVGQAAQASLENLKTALGGGTIATAVGPPATKSYVPAGTGTLTQSALLFRGKAPTVGGVAKTRDVQMAYSVPVGAVELAAKKAPDKQLIGCDFRLVKVTGTDLFKFIDLT